MIGVHTHLASAVDFLTDQIVALELESLATDDGEVDPLVTEYQQRVIEDANKINTQVCWVRDYVAAIMADLCEGLNIDNPRAFFVAIHQCGKGERRHASQ